VLGDQKVDEEVDPLTQCIHRRFGAGQQARTRLGARLDLVAVDGGDEIRPRREVAVDRPHPDTRFGRDLADRRVDA
jgi:hypothetical protein